jgi:hypothetical protein
MLVMWPVPFQGDDVVGRHVVNVYIRQRWQKVVSAEDHSELGILKKRVLD